MKSAIFSTFLFAALPQVCFGQSVSTEKWGCLYVKGFQPGRRLVKWCDINSSADPILCYHIEQNNLAPDDRAQPFKSVSAIEVTEKRSPGEDCPLLPGNRNRSVGKGIRDSLLTDQTNE